MNLCLSICAPLILHLKEDIVAVSLLRKLSYDWLPLINRVSELGGALYSQVETSDITLNQELN